ncbi:MAG: hypothetical protein Q9190_004921 [Brigantiaea leucoxantha]
MHFALFLHLLILAPFTLSSPFPQSPTSVQALSFDPPSQNLYPPGQDLESCPVNSAIPNQWPPAQQAPNRKRQEALPNCAPIAWESFTLFAPSAAGPTVPKNVKTEMVSLLFGNYTFAVVDSENLLDSISVEIADPVDGKVVGQVLASTELKNGVGQVVGVVSGSVLNVMVSMNFGRPVRRVQQGGVQVAVFYEKRLDIVDGLY